MHVATIVNYSGEPSKTISLLEKQLAVRSSCSSSSLFTLYVNPSQGYQKRRWDNHCIKNGS